MKTRELSKLNPFSSRIFNIQMKAFSFNIFWVTFFVTYFILGLINRHLMQNGFFYISTLKVWMHISNFLFTDHGSLLTFLSDYPQIPGIMSLIYNLLPGSSSVLGLIIPPILIVSFIMAFFAEFLLIKGFKTSTIFILGCIILSNPYFLWGFSSGPGQAYQILLMGGFFAGITIIHQGEEARGFLIFSSGLALLFFNNYDGILIASVTILFLPFLFNRRLFKQAPLGVYIVSFFPLVSAIFSTIYLGRIIHVAPSSLVTYWKFLGTFYPTSANSVHLGNYSNISLIAMEKIIFYSALSFLSLAFINRGQKDTIGFLFKLAVIPIVASFFGAWLGLLDSPNQIISTLISLIPIAFIFNKFQHQHTKKRFIIIIFLINVTTSWFAFSDQNVLWPKTIHEINPDPLIDSDEIQLFDWVNDNYQYKTVLFFNNDPRFFAGINMKKAGQNIFTPESDIYQKILLTRSIGVEQFIVKNVYDIYEGQDEISLVFPNLFDQGAKNYSPVFTGLHWKIYRRNDLDVSTNYQIATSFRPKMTIYDRWGGDEQWTLEMMKGAMALGFIMIVFNLLKYWQRTQIKKSKKELP